MVLGRKGFTTAVEGTNGFLCLVERSVSHGKSLAERTFRRPGATDSRCCRRRAIVVSERVAFLSADCGHLAVADVAGDDNPVFRGRGRHTSGKLPPRRKHRGTAP